MTRSTKDSSSAAGKKVKTTPIAIIGIGSIFPQAHNRQEYWDNILRKIDCISDVPASRWSIEDYYDPDPTKPDKTYCKRGGFIPDVEFDPMEFGLPPNILEVTDVSQLLSLVVARDALDDAGYGEERQFDREHTGVVLGVVGMSSKIFTPLMTRLQYPVWDKVLRSAGISEQDSQKIIDKMKLAYISWEENAFPGAIGNVIAGRICNRFDLGGVNCVIDAACASSLAAVKMAVGELIEGRADMMITGGVDTDNSINTYMCFSKTPAFSKSDRVRTFDAQSDGMMVGEGIGMVVLKRLEDAERDGDRVYAVIQAVGTSSDGRFKSIYAPRPAGQARALRRAYEEAGFAPQTVGLVEAHGTGTMAGDPSEFQGMNEVFGEGNDHRQSIALGSVKSQIAHTKAAAGIASLIKTSLALYHKVLPPTINVSQPNPKFNIENTPFYINTETRPWIRAASAVPRRAGVSSFGFGGTNYHVVLQEAQAEHSAPYRVNRVPRSVVLSATSPVNLKAECQKELQALQSEGGKLRFAQLVNESKSAVVPEAAARVGFVAETPEEAAQALQICVENLSARPEAESWEHPRGIYYRSRGIDTRGKVVALFSGQGSQYLEMGRELALNFPTMRQVYSELDELFLQDGLEPLSSRVFPPPVFDPKVRDGLAETLQRTEHAQPAIGAFSVALYKIFEAAGFQANFTAGHSFGELTALWAAGVLSDADYYALAKARGKAMAPPNDPGFDAGTMAAVKGDVEKVRALLAGDPEVTLANWNSHNQLVIAGSKTAVGRARQALEAKGFQVVLLPVSAAFHTHLVGHAQKPFAAALEKAGFQKPRVKVYANGTGQPHDQDPNEIRKAMARHILNPVLFRDEIQNIYGEGGRIFIEFGPKNVLTNLVGNILEGQPHLAVALNSNAKKDSDRQLREAVVQLRVAGLPLVNFDSFELPMPVQPARKKSPVAVTLNGGYYVTEKTRSAFEKALNDGFRVSQAVAQPAAVPQPAAVAQPAAVPQPVNGKSQPAAVAVESMPVSQTEVEQLLASYQSHQSETVRLHEQYLRTEEEYARAFAHLTQLQTELVSRGSQAGNELQAVIPLFESLERSMTRFHEHQAETLRIHQRYLETQERFADTMVQAVSTGVPVMAAPARVTPADAYRPMPISTPAVVPAVAPAVIPVITPAVAVSGNGNGHAHHSPEPVKAVVEPVAAVPAVSAVVNSKSLAAALLQIVSDKTGYPVETLELDMDMEADLGIDSIKRVEILGGIQSQFPELPKPDAAALSELRTLRRIIDFLNTAGEPVAEVAVPVVESQPPTPAAPVSRSLSADVVTQSLLQIVSDKTGYPVETLELDMDMEADLGIDSIKRVEILGGIQSQFPELPKPDAAALSELRTLRQIIDFLGTAGEPVAGVAVPVVIESQPPAPAIRSLSAEVVTQSLLQIVSDKTGYPVETLELDMDMEADLGIDSIKRVEILGGIQSQFPELPKTDAAALSELRTLRQIIDFLNAAEIPVQVSAEPAESVLPEEFRPFDPGVEQGIVTRKLLPPPDALQFQLPEGTSCLVTDNGTPVTAALVSELVALGWPVAVLRFPQDLAASHLNVPQSVMVVELPDLSEAQLQASLDLAAQKLGPAAVFIHLAPSFQGDDDFHLAFPETERALLKLVFLAAKHLKPALNNAAEKGRAAFVTATWLDGELGVGHTADYTPLNGGLFGLVKSLNLEWENVFCRAIDFSPSLDAAQAAQYILAELQDPNRLLIEVAYNHLHERSTLTLQAAALPVTGGRR